MPIVIEKTATKSLGGDSFTRKQLGAEIALQSKADLHSMLVGITREDSAQQQQMGNPPQLVVVDGMTNKPVQSVTAKVVVLFGTVLARAAMRMVETELKANIIRSTTSRSGALVNLSANWQWRFIPKGGMPRVVTSATPPSTFSLGDKLVLVPVNVPHASAANRAVSRSGRLTAAAKGRKRGSKSTQNIGFMAKTTAAVKRRSEFAQFRVMVEHTLTHAVPGELRKIGGTAVITIRPRFKQLKAV
jgi:hypothetical protein